jgi:hypothetical protein
MKQKRVVELIRREIGSMSQVKFCDLFSINPTVLSDVLRGHKPPTEQLCNMVGVERVTVVQYRKRESA